jgi:hypothetical protein
MPFVGVVIYNPAENQYYSHKKNENEIIHSIQPYRYVFQIFIQRIMDYIIPDYYLLIGVIITSKKDENRK